MQPVTQRVTQIVGRKKGNKKLAEIKLLVGSFFNQISAWHGMGIESREGNKMPG